MIRVAGLWDQGWNVPLSESYLWSFPLREYGAKEWAMTPVTGIIHNEVNGGMVLTEYNDVEQMVREFTPEGFTRVFVDEKGETPLEDLAHPENAVYFFGRAGDTPMRYKKEGDLSVKLVTVTNNGVMWPHQCLVAVMQDRFSKQRRGDR